MKFRFCSPRVSNPPNRSNLLWSRCCTPATPAEEEEGEGETESAMAAEDGFRSVATDVSGVASSVAHGLATPDQVQLAKRAEAGLRYFHHHRHH